MTAAIEHDPIGEFTAALNAASRRAFRMSPMEHPPLIYAAIANGWTPRALGRRCSLGDNSHNYVAGTLRNCATDKPPPEHGPTTGRYIQPLPWCGHCDDPQTRWALDDDGHILSRCPTCWTVSA